MTAMHVQVTHESGSYATYNTGVEVTDGIVLDTIHVSDPHPQVRTLSLLVGDRGVHIPWERVLKVEEIGRA